MTGGGSTPQPTTRLAWIAIPVRRLSSSNRWTRVPGSTAVPPSRPMAGPRYHPKPAGGPPEHSCPKACREPPPSRLCSVRRPVGAILPDRPRQLPLAGSQGAGEGFPVLPLGGRATLPFCPVSASKTDHVRRPNIGQIVQAKSPDLESRHSHPAPPSAPGAESLMRRRPFTPGIRWVSPRLGPTEDRRPEGLLLWCRPECRPGVGPGCQGVHALTRSRNLVTGILRRSKLGFNGFQPYSISPADRPHP